MAATRKGSLLEAHQLLAALEKMTGTRDDVRTGDGMQRVRRLLSHVQAPNLPTNINNLVWHMWRLPVLGAICAGKGAGMAELARCCNEEQPWVVVSDYLLPTAIDSLYLVRYAPSQEVFQETVTRFLKRGSPSFVLGKETSHGFYVTSPLASFMSR